MNQPKQSEKPPSQLNDKIDELDELLENKAELKVSKPPLNIPVLDEMIDYRQESVLRNVPPKAVVEATMNKDANIISEEQISLVLDKMENKLVGELDSLVDELKNSIKDNLLTDIKTQLRSDSNHEKKTQDEQNNSSDTDNQS